MYNIFILKNIKKWFYLVNINKGITLRLTAHNILYNIYKNNRNIDDALIQEEIKKNISKDISFINNICLNSMRFRIHSKKIIDRFVKKKPKIHEEILLICAITQLVFLDFKDYAVINSSVEVAKKLKIYHGFINATLKEINKNKDSLKKTKISFNDLPSWFLDQSLDLNKNNKDLFLKSITEKPSLHLIFKNKEDLSNFEGKINKSSPNSGFVQEKIEISKLQSYLDGRWWVQDYSSSYPLNNIPDNLLSKKNIDLCAAPGGKAFQILSKEYNLILNDKNKSRIKLLKSNLKRLRFKGELSNKNVSDIKPNIKYNFIILDAPCSAVGTIRKNPEIFFKCNGPDIKSLSKLQENMLNKASSLVEKNGIVLYMVCSFLKFETTELIENFLLENKNFILDDFYLKNRLLNDKNIVKDKYMHTVPNKINGFNIDGYFAAYLRRIN